MIWILCIIGLIALLVILGLVFDTNPVLILKAIIQKLVLMAIVIGIGCLIGYLAGAENGEKWGFGIGCLICCLFSYMEIVDRHTTEEGSIDDCNHNRMHRVKDSKVDGWVGIVMLIALLGLVILGSLVKL